jgi:DNA repair protein RadC
MNREEKRRIESFEDLREAVQDMKSLESETLRAFYLDSGNNVVRTEEFGGEVDSVELSPRELLKPGVESDASAVVIAHNHPSGSSEPTNQDLEATERIIEAGSSLGIEVMDHAVVGRKVSSMRGSTSLWRRRRGSTG